MSNTQERQSLWAIWTLWVLATVSGYLWTLVIFWATHGIPPSTDKLVFRLGLGILGGIAIMATAQALILRWYIKPIRWQRWIILTTLSYIVGLFIISFSLYTQHRLVSAVGIEPRLSNLVVITGGDTSAVIPGLYLNVMVCASLTGALVGLLQSRILRRHISRTGWWVAANALALTATVLVMGSSALIAPREVNSFIGWLIILSVLGIAIAGAITGAALVRLLKEPRVTQTSV